MSAASVFLPLPLERLDELWFLLDEGANLDEQARADLARAIFFYKFDLREKIKAATPGRPEAPQTWELALATKILLQTHSGTFKTVKAAVAALLPHGNASEMDRVMRAYRKLVHRRGPLPRSISVEQRTIDAAAARAQSGNK